MITAPFNWPPHHHIHFLGLVGVDINFNVCVHVCMHFTNCIQRWLQICTLLCIWSWDGRTCHLTFIVYYDTHGIFKIKKHAILPLVWTLLSNYHCWMYLLSEIWGAFWPVAITMSPTPAAGSLFRCPLTPFTEVIHRFWGPVLSAQSITAPIWRSQGNLEFLTEDPPRPRLDILNSGKGQKGPFILVPLFQATLYILNNLL